MIEEDIQKIGRRKEKGILLGGYLEHVFPVLNIIEINHYIASSSFSPFKDKDVRIWTKSKYECVKTIKDTCCLNSNGISNLRENTLILGAKNELFIRYFIFSISII